MKRHTRFSSPQIIKLLSDIVMNHVWVDPLSFMESPLHLAMKKAVIRDHAGDRYWVESTQRYTGLRVDVDYMLHSRNVLVECETRPNMRRLKEKGTRRNNIRYRNVYILVVTTEQFKKHDWMELRGSFDKVLAYDREKDAFTEELDLRHLGWLRDATLDLLVPIYKHEAVQQTIRKINTRYYLTRHALRIIVQCSACKLNVQTPWVFCPRFGCPDSRPYC